MNNFKTIILLLMILPNMVLSDSWSLKNLKINSNNGLFSLKLNSLRVPMSDDEISNLTYQCKDSQKLYPLHQCSSGLISFDYLQSSYALTVAGWVDFQTQEWKLTVSNIDSQIQIQLDSSNKNKLNIKIENMKLSNLVNFLDQFIQTDASIAMGVLSADLEIDFKDLITIKAVYAIEDLTWESTSGDYVLDSSNHRGEIKLVQTPSEVVVSIVNNLVKGEGLFKDIYVLFDKNPVTTEAVIDFDNAFDPKSALLTIHSTPDIEFKISLDDWYQNNIRIQYKVNDLNLLYQGFLASYLEILGINNLVISGQSQGNVLIKNDKIAQVDLSLTNTNMTLLSKKMLAENINAQINWKNSGVMQASNMSWDKLLIAGMPITKSALNFSASGQQLELKQSTELPIFDGSILIRKLVLKDLFKPQITIDFDGEVMPISIALITEKMGWPIMQGSISGTIPAMRKIGHSIKFDGSLNLNVFDGKMQINALSTERLFGIAPVISADIDFQQLNLQQITSTFDFGEITGLVDGYVNELRITNWKADRLDAQIYSVKSKQIKQTISQRAIDNISSIGGIQGALSRSFLRFFDYFKYKNIGIGCKLRNSICEMSGLKTVNDSYQLIEGRGLPSINIMGYRRFIDWEIFLDRLLNAGY